MAPDPVTASDPRGRLAAARAAFVGNLARRLDGLSGALRSLREQPRSTARRTTLLRRLHALGAAARVLGFGGIAEALRRAESILSHAEAVTCEVLDEIERIRDGLPKLVWAAPDPPPRADEAQPWPLSVVVLASEPLVQALSSTEHVPALEVEVAQTPEHVQELARIIGPDVLVVDGDIAGVATLLQRLQDDAMVLPLPTIVLSSSDVSDAGGELVRLGVARMLTKPVPPETLQNAIVQVALAERAPASTNEPLGNLTVDALAERIAAEVRRGLADAAIGENRDVAVEFGQGNDVLAAIWGAVARVRELVTVRSSGVLRFDPEGPEGAIPIAPWGTPERRAGERGGRQTRAAEDVSITGRKIVVADDDPAVVWFLSGLLRAAGAEVIEAHDGGTALQLAFRLWPDVIVSDVLMPELDGFSLCRAVKRDVAVRDAPVILLSWKEDLLQRVRELGADADGYLRKEATASLIVQRVREVLRPRARVEERVASGGEVRGRLDGLTPRLVLQLACASGGDVRASFRDAAYLYEVHVRAGRPVSAMRTASDGTHESGLAVLGALLGVSAGRFIVVPDGSRVRQEFHGTLEDVLSEPIQKARAAQAVLASENLARACRIEIDSAVLAGYLSSTPDPARALIQRLISGDSPREMLLIGDVSSALLDAVLNDVSRRGAVRRVDDIQGRDLLPDAADALRRRSESVRSLVSPSLRAPRTVTPVPPAIETPRSTKENPVFTFQLSPVPPDANDSAGPEFDPYGSPPAAMRFEEVASVPQPAIWPLNPNVTPPVGRAAAPAALKVEHHTLRGLGDDLSPLPVRAITMPRPSGSGRGMVASDSDVPSSLADSPAPPSPGASSSAAPDLLSQAFPQASPLISSVDEQRGGDVRAERGYPATVELAPERFRADDCDAEEQGTSPERFRAEDCCDAEEQATSSAIAHEEREPTVQPPLASDEGEWSGRRALVSERASIGLSGARQSARVPSGSSLDDGVTVGAADEEDEGTSRELRDSDAETPHPTTGALRERRSDNRWLGALRLGATAAVAGLLSFGGVRLLVGSDATPAAAESNGAAAADAPAVAPPPVAASSAAAQPKPVTITTEQLDLPDGVALPSGKALLEIETGGKQSIYVDGVFVGRGPLRRVPVDPGTHEIRTKSNDRERTDSASAVAGRRTRIPLSDAWK